MSSDFLISPRTAKKLQTLIGQDPRPKGFDFTRWEQIKLATLTAITEVEAGILCCEYGQEFLETLTHYAEDTTPLSYRTKPLQFGGEQ